MQRRRDAWQYVTDRVNAVSGTRRTWEEVRKKVHDLKKSTKARCTVVVHMGAPNASDLEEVCTTVLTNVKPAGVGISCPDVKKMYSPWKEGGLSGCFLDFQWLNYKRLNKIRLNSLGSSKEKLAYNQRSHQGAGGGPQDIKILTEFENDMIVMFGKKSLEGLQPVDIGTMPRNIIQREQSGLHILSGEERQPSECQLSNLHEAGTSTETSLVGGIKTENQGTPSESLSTSEEWEEVVVGDEGTMVESWRPSIIVAPTCLDAVTDLNGPAFKRRLLGHGIRVEQSLAFMHTALEDGMARLDPRLASPVASAVETSLMQSIGTVGASFMNAHCIGMEVLGSKLKEAVVAGFGSLGEQLHLSMAEGFRNLIEA